VLLSYIFVKIHKLPLRAVQKTSVIQNSKTLKRESFEPRIHTKDTDYKKNVTKFWRLHEVAKT